MNKYERLTQKTIGCFEYDLKDFKHKVGEFADYDAFFAYSTAVRRLGALEDKIEDGTLIEIPCVRYNKERSCWQAIYEKMGVITTCNCGDEEMAKYKLDIEAQVKLKESEK